MKKTIAAIIAFCGLFAAFADAGAELVLSLDLARKNTAISWTWTEYCDTAVRVTVMRNGEDFPVAGWDASLVLGGTASGCVVEGVRSGYNDITFTVPAFSMPTNGKYTVQINAMKDRRSEEWGRGNVRVNMNPGMAYMPTCWMGYQKVAQLAASMITVDLITNDVVRAVQSNFYPKATGKVDPYTNDCFLVGFSFVPEVVSGARFFWDGESGDTMVFRNVGSPGVFKSRDGSVSNAEFELYRDGVRISWTNNTKNVFVSTATNEVKRFKASAWFGSEAQKKAALGR